jgi:hypothetical protein
VDATQLLEGQGSIAALAHNVTREVQGLILSNGKFQSLYELEKKKASTAQYAALRQPPLAIRSHWLVFVFRTDLERLRAQLTEVAALKSQLSELAALKEQLAKAEHGKKIAITKYTNLLAQHTDLQRKFDALAPKK